MKKKGCFVEVDKHHKNMEEMIRESMQAVEEMDLVELESLTELFRSFGDSTRVRILSVLMRGEICVNDLAEALEMSQSAISHQLRILKQNRLVKSRRDGKQILYSLDDEHVQFILTAGVQHIREYR